MGKKWPSLMPLKKCTFIRFREDRRIESILNINIGHIWDSRLTTKVKKKKIILWPSGLWHHVIWQKMNSRGKNIYPSSLFSKPTCYNEKICQRYLKHNGEKVYWFIKRKLRNDYKIAKEFRNMHQVLRGHVDDRWDWEHVHWHRVLLSLFTNCQTDLML